jgi:3-hydroxymyristoyl/3-hydroxydecanoyl-(acyl carrier protein) dehydratase
MQKPIIKNKTQDETSLKLDLIFPANAEYFDGHFDEFPVLAGVVQLNYVMELAQEYFHITPHITNITKLKFTKIIKPDTDISLAINYLKGESKINFKYFLGDVVYSSGNINLN